MSCFSLMTFRLAACGVAFFLTLAQTSFAEPTVRAVSIRGLQIDGTTTIVVDGTGLLPEPQLALSVPALSVPIVKQVVKPGATATRVEFEVTLDSRVEPGLYSLWVVSGEGVSQPAVIAADRFPQVAFAPEIAALPVALHGSVGGSSRLRTSFAAKAGQVLLIEAEAQRLGGQLRPVLHIFDSENRQLDWTLPSPALRGDARLKFTAPADGQYTVELHDLQYAAPAPNFFRLKIGSWQLADLVFPPAVQAGTKTQLTLFGGSTNGEQVEFDASSSNGESFRSAPWKDVALAGGFRPPVLISEFPELVEAPPAESPQKLSEVPVAISGRFLAAGELDKYQIDVVPGAKLRFEVFAARLGSPVDATLEIQNEAGGRLALNDDAAGSPDPLLDYTVPADVKTLLLTVTDTDGRFGPDCIYRVAVTPIPGSGGSPDFRLAMTQQSQSVAAGDRILVKVVADRNEFDGPIELRFDSLPAGIQVQGTQIAAGTSATLLTLHGAGGGLAHSLTKLRGTARIDGRILERVATVESHVLGEMQPWLRGEIGVAVTPASQSGFKADWGNLGVDAQLVLGGKLDVPVSAVRPAGFDGPVRLTLETSQREVRVANQQIDTNRTIRSETNQPIEIVVDATAQKAWDAKLAADKVVVDAKVSQATVAASGQTAVAAAETAAKNASAQLVAMKDQASKAAAALKVAGEADAVAQKALDAVVAQVKATAEAADKADAATLEAAAKAAAAAATLAKTTADQKAATGKAVVAAAAVSKTADDAVVAADLIVVAATAALKAATEAAAKADTEAAAKTTDAETKLQAAIQAAESASALAKNDGVFSIFVPAELSENGYDLALRAELLSRDKNTVLARSDTSVRRLTTLIPIVVSLTGSDKLAGQIDPKSGSTVAVTGKVERLAGMNQDVTVTLSGLPAGIAVPSVVVKPDQTEFALNVVFPATFQPAELTAVAVIANGKMRPNAPIDVRSKELPLSISLTAPPAAAPKTP
ncbi:MAG: hypothetical protein O2820_16675 [Planctomycetota bacterium]|nr:hypothetical protein [Planctomycetota bacterium]MDA1250855.1 hypothetical protein [Planctomycetota bacterium]